MEGLVISFSNGFVDHYKSGVVSLGMTTASTLVIVVMAVIAVAVAVVATSQIPTMRFRDDAHNNGTTNPATEQSSYMLTKKNRGYAEETSANHHPTTTARRSGGPAVPVDVKFVALEQIDWSVLSSELAAYERERHAALESLSFQLEVVRMEAMDDEGGPDAGALQWLIGRIQDKMQHLSGLYEHDQQALSDMLRPFQYSLALPPPPPTNGSTTGAVATSSTDGGALLDLSLGGEGAPTSSLLDCPMEVCRKRWTSPPADGSSASPASVAVYSTVSQVVAHLVRDWSADGAVIRQSLYDWCVQNVRDRSHEFQATRATQYDDDGTCGSTEAAANLSILVPGAGLGRLAYDLAAALSVVPSKECPDRDSGKVVSGNEASRTGQAQFRPQMCPAAFEVHVHAVEPSLTMMAAAAHVFDRQEQYQLPQQPYGETPPTQKATVLHPYASDPFTNEVDDEGDEDNKSSSGRSSFQSQRYRAVTIERPALLAHDKFGKDDDIQPSSPSAFLSFTVGDFASAVRAFRPAEGAPMERAAASPFHLHHFVVTCFFLDTATNPIEYLRLVHEALQPDGCWINVGPLQWHVNAHLALTSQELRRLVAGMGFEIVFWKVDDLPLEYRSSRRRHSGPNGSTTTNADSTGSAPHTTRMEAYHPLRFVARKEPAERP